ncbi:MAG TPA: hypothetical protein DCL15_06885 [Chloroflexi bacterium]|nr:hypothetical protein [Chloroflexota bacterium]HHW87787.1 glycosyltransferase [Chloroflexota bacterium]
MTKCRVLLAGTFAPGALERSYAAGFEDAGCNVQTFDIAGAINRYCRLGRFGRMFNTFVPVEPWIRKANRDLVLLAMKSTPDLIAVFGQNRVRSGALAQIRSMLPNVRLVYVWPDTLVNLGEASISALPLFDLIATYSQSTVQQFEYLGARHVAWVPLAGDPHMHGVSSITDAERHTFGAEIAFVGQWRPERQAAMEVVLQAFPERDVKIWGLDWGRRARDHAAIQKAWQGRPLYEKEFALALATSQINLNIIDDTNYPAANMRFFEIPTAGGLQVCSACPEMENSFRHEDTVFYYRSLAELPAILRQLLDDTKICNQVKTAASQLLLSQHTYKHRSEMILRLLNDVID